jgi:hypothetical protein
MMLLRTIITSVSCILLASIVLSGDVQAGTIYEYVDKDGSVVLTDSPPPETKVRPVQNYRDMTEADKQEMEKEKCDSCCEECDPCDPPDDEPYEPPDEDP